MSDAITLFSYEFKQGCDLVVNLKNGMPCSLALAHLYSSSGAKCGLDVRCEELWQSENRKAPVGHYSCTVTVKEVKQVVLTAHAVVAKEATVKLLNKLEHIILLHDLSAVCHVLNAGYLLSSQRRSKSDGQLTAATFHLANTNAVAHVAARCTRCIHTRCIHT